VGVGEEALAPEGGRPLDEVLSRDAEHAERILHVIRELRGSGSPEARSEVGLGA